MIPLEYCCPRCRGEVERRPAAYRCSRCPADYPILHGIPDFRVYADPYIALEADRAKGLLLAEKAQSLDFASLVAYYYSITPEVPPDNARRYQAHHLSGVVRGRAVLDRLEAYFPQRTFGPGTLLLDLGCGTAGCTVAATGWGMVGVGVDVAFRWLVVARKRLDELGCGGVTLVAACADYLPFKAAPFGLIVAEGLLEHTRDPRLVLREARRVATPGAALIARTINRLALAPEPHVNLWGVGFLPRSLMDAYVRRFRGIPYEHIRLESYPALQRLVAELGEGDLRVVASRLAEADYQHHPASKRRLLAAYWQLHEQIPLLQPLLTLFGPSLDIVGNLRPERKEVRPARTQIVSKHSETP